MFPSIGKLNTLSEHYIFSQDPSRSVVYPYIIVGRREWNSFRNHAFPAPFAQQIQVALCKDGWAQRESLFGRHRWCENLV